MSATAGVLGDRRAGPLPMPARPPAASTRQIITASLVGNVMEWYDFAVYGYFAVAIGAAFFPADDPVASTLAAFGVFAAGFLARPVGGALFGHIGDRFGRKRALLASVALMAVPTVLIGLLPTHAQLGNLAGLLLVVLRLLQGLAVGGEFTTSIVYVVEHAPASHRGRHGSWMEAGAIAGILFGSAAGTLVANLLSPEALGSWGWRVPFLFGIGVAGLGIWLRRQLPDVPSAGTDHGEQHSPLAAALASEWRTILRLILLCLPSGVAFYILFVYVVSYLQTLDRIPPREALDINTISMTVLIGCALLGGALSDRFGRKPVAVIAMTGLLLLSWPLFTYLGHPVFNVMLASQVCFALLVGLYAGQLPAMLAESLPRQVRCTAASISYNLSVGLFGGLTPMTATWLIHRTGDEMIPAMLLLGVAALTLLGLWRAPETAGKPLR